MTRLITLCSFSIYTLTLSAQGFPNRHPFPQGMGMAQSRTPVTGAPYSAIQTTQTQRLLSDGNQVSRTEQSKVYRDSQGRTRVERTITPPASSGKQPYTEAVIVDPVAHYRYVLNSATMIATQTPLPTPSGSSMTGNSPTWSGRPGGIQINTVDLGTQTINSVPATGTQVTETIPAGAMGNAQAITIVRTTWISTALKVPVEVKTSDPRFGTTDLELTSIVQAEPDPSLFTVPSGYTVKTGGVGGARRGWAKGGVR
jgi:hypothetical protein